MHIREFSYIYKSRIDFTDLWVNLTLTILGLHFILFNTTDVQPYYQYLTRAGWTSDGIGSILIFTGLLNVIRIFLPFRIKPFVCVLIKSLSLFIMLFLLFSVSITTLIPPVIVYYFMVSLLYLDNIMRTK